MLLQSWKINDPWPYFHRIEREIIEISEYIHFDNYNENAYGERIAKLIIVIGSEIDTNLRIMTGGKRESNMKSWKKWLLKWNHFITKLYIDNRLNFRSNSTPFEHLDENKGYEWWTSYNSIKHNRHENFELATIATLMEISAALFVVNCYCTYTKPHMFQNVLHCRLFFNSMPWGFSDPRADITPLDKEIVTRDVYCKSMYPKEGAIFPSESYYNLRFKIE